MAVNAELKQTIDTNIKKWMPSKKFEETLNTILEALFLLADNRPDDIVETSAYLAYRISAQLVQSDNYDDQAYYAADVTNVLQNQYEDPAKSALLEKLSLRQIIEVVRNIYNFHLALTVNGYDGPRQVAYPPKPGDPLRLLRNFVSAVSGAAESALQINTDESLDLYNRIIEEDGIEKIDIGRRRSVGLPSQIRTVTWNLQGSSDSIDNKWRKYILWLARAAAGNTGSGVVALQAVGPVPTSARRLQRLIVSDQFGVSREVYEYLWKVETDTDADQYHIYRLAEPDHNVDLALVVPESNSLVIDKLVIVADGVSADKGQGFSPALGAVFRQPGASQALTVYTFDTTPGGETPTAPRMLREIAWHTTTSNFALVGEFDLDPVTYGDWVNPSGLATIYEANGNTFAGEDTYPGVNQMTMLDYAVAQGMAFAPAQARGQIQNNMGSYHRPVLFYLQFPFG